MPRPIAFRQSLWRIRILFAVGATIFGSYTLISHVHSSSNIRTQLKPFTFSLDFSERYGYADDDTMISVLEAGSQEPMSSDMPSKSKTAAERLIDSGRESCRGWTVPRDEAEMIEREESSTCWKDRHHRQIKRYLELADSDKTYRELSWHNDLNKNNIQSLQSLLHCLPFYGSTEGLPDGCYDAQTSVIVTQDWWVDMAVTGGGESGEAQWLRTMTDTLQEENYTSISLSHWDYKALVTLHNIIPDVITFVYGQDFVMLSCLSDPRCRSDFPPDSPEVEAVPMEERGTIPSWKLFTLSYWGARPANHTKSSAEFGNRPDDDFTYNPLGNEWTISPFPYPDHTYLPMSLEKMCTQVDVVPQSERKDEVTVLGKLFQYFYPHRIGAAIPIEFWPDFEAETSLTPIANARTLYDHDIEKDTPPGIVNRGPLSKQDYSEQVAYSKAYLGIGRPEISPSPYLALCQGVPVILPYYGETAVPEGWDLYHAELAQHGPAASIGPPYVYSYHWKDPEGLYEAVRAARDHPIDRYIPDDMRYEHVRSEVLKLVNIDWEARAREIEDERERQGEPRQGLVKQHVVERIFERGSGRRIDETGEASKILH